MGRGRVPMLHDHALSPCWQQGQATKLRAKKTDWKACRGQAELTVLAHINWTAQ